MKTPWTLIQNCSLHDMETLCDTNTKLLRHKLAYLVVSDVELLDVFAEAAVDGSDDGRGACADRESRLKLIHRLHQTDKERGREGERDGGREGGGEGWGEGEKVEGEKKIWNIRVQ